MSKDTGISWTDHTLNFWWGCEKVSPGCKHCYAETWAKRMGKDVFGPPKTTSRSLTKGPWLDILKWDKQAGLDGVRRKVFCMSMGDFFEDHPQVQPWRERAYPLLAGLKNLDVQLLTKRIEHVNSMVPESWLTAWPEHIMIMTSVENQDQADKRIPELLRIPAKYHGISVEPMLEEIVIGGLMYRPADPAPRSPQLDWVICGGESGANCRSFDMDWALRLAAECSVTNIAFWMKQLGGFPDKRDNMEEWPSDLCVQELPKGWE